MQLSEAVGPEPKTDFSIRENAICKMQDVLSRYLPRFQSTAYRQLGNAADAEDAVQDAFLAGYKRGQRLRPLIAEFRKARSAKSKQQHSGHSAT